jgi:predicted phage terminase large subunit-like protein
MDSKGNPIFEQIRNYTDTADEGADHLCSINYGVYQGEAYLLDVYYTKEGMEITEPATAKFMLDSDVNLAKIESNNGGRGFARSVERILWDTHKSRSVIIKWFHQTENKKARIMTQSSFVQEHIYFPLNWKDRWPEFYKSMTTYLKEGKNKHDDAQDCITGVAESIQKRSGVRIGPVHY